MIKDTIDPYHSIARGLLIGYYHPYVDFHDNLFTLSAEQFSERLQGDKVLGAEKLIATMEIQSQNPIVLEKIQWLQEHMREEAAKKDSKWLEDFLFCVTAQRALTAQSKIIITANPYNPLCKAQTCFNTLLIPTNPSSKEEFFEKLEELMKDKGFSMA
ncbi:MAG: hypothetical protein K2X08_02540 [Chlamydiales bacterium]|nr:hypothetical protein [Chlamydiales bacterium]